MTIQILGIHDIKTLPLIRNGIDLYMQTAFMHAPTFTIDLIHFFQFGIPVIVTVV